MNICPINRQPCMRPEKCDPPYDCLLAEEANERFKRLREREARLPRRYTVADENRCNELDAAFGRLAILLAFVAAILIFS